MTSQYGLRAGVRAPGHRPAIPSRLSLHQTHERADDAPETIHHLGIGSVEVAQRHRHFEARHRLARRAERVVIASRAVPSA
jgi:hypothetical protein